MALVAIEFVAAGFPPMDVRRRMPSPMINAPHTVRSMLREASSCCNTYAPTALSSLFISCSEIPIARPVTEYCAAIPAKASIARRPFCSSLYCLTASSSKVMSQLIFQPSSTGPAPNPRSPAILSSLTSKRQPRKPSIKVIICTNCHIAASSTSRSGIKPVRGVSRMTTLKVASMATRPCISSASRYQRMASNLKPEFSRTSLK
mmetsp:Transcript_97828/g.245120  ORF Transcript_97828/g.245120 Transcript_97828/m.245120 type:complete len:204 (+) Transcript_97828:1330-1941(+)